MSQASLKTIREVFKIEAEAIRRMIPKVGGNYQKAIRLMEQCEGRVILTGMGKSGFIAGKIAATLASTGTPSFALHPAEAVHGDLGMVTEKDVLMAISQSGETEEIVRLIETIKKIGIPLIALTSNLRSTLAKNSDVTLDLGVTREACSLNLAPSASTTASLAVGDALALALHKKKKFRPEDFASLHPAGSLGRKLLKVKDIMRTGKSNPVVKRGTTLRQALLKITQARAGSCTVIDQAKKVYGIFTDGDLRRHLRDDGEKILNQSIDALLTRNPCVIEQDQLAAEAFHVLKTKKIDEVPVVDARGRAVGLLDVQDLLKAGVV